MKIHLLLIALFVITSASAAHAVGGCVDSPECPTAVLAAVGTAAVIIVRRFKK